MKHRNAKYIKLALSFTILTLACLIVWQCFRRKNDAYAFSQFPKIEVQTICGESTSLYEVAQGNERMVLMFFSPNCEFCQHETDLIINNREQLTNFQFVFITHSEPDSLDEFIALHPLNLVSNSSLIIDDSLALHNYYKVNTIPTFIFFDEKKQYVRRIGGATTTDVIQKLCNGSQE